MWEERLGGHVIYPVKTIGVLSVYYRKEYRKWGLPKYVVFRGGVAVEEFRTWRAAIKWAKTYQNG